MKRFNKVLSVVACIGLFSIFALGSGSSDASSSSDAEKVGEIVAATNDATETTSNTPEVSETVENVESEQTEYYVGETLSKDGLHITYVSSSNYTSDNQFIQPAEGNKFIRLFFHVDNQSGSDKSVSAFEFNCYADGYECSATYPDDALSASLSDGRSTDGAVYFEVPIDAMEIEIEYEIDWLNSKKVKFIFEGDKESGLEFENNAQSSEEAFHVGDIIETEDLRISYISADEYKSDNMFIQPSDGNKYVYIQLEVENLSDSDQMISYMSFECYADGVACDAFYGMEDALSATLSAGRKAKGTIAYEVPAEAQIIEFEFEDNIWTDSKIIFKYE